MNKLILGHYQLHIFSLIILLIHAGECLWCKRKKNKHSAWTALELFEIFSAHKCTGKVECFSSCCASEYIIWIIAFIGMQLISDYYFMSIVLHRVTTLARGNCSCAKCFTGVRLIQIVNWCMLQNWFNHLIYNIATSVSLMPICHMSLCSYIPVNTRWTIKPWWCRYICKGVLMLP